MKFGLLRTSYWLSANVNKSTIMTSSFTHSWLKSENENSRTRNRRRKGIYEDVLEERRRDGDTAWILHSRTVPRFQYGLEPNSVKPKEIKRQVLKSDKLLYGLKEICEETGRPLPELLKEAEGVLDEMGHNLNMFAVRSFAFAVTKVVKSLYRSVYVNPEGIERLRNACQQYPVIIMPMHRSYFDFLLAGYILFDYDLPMPAIASAMVFMGMKFIGTILRNCGAFFIRRSFSTDRVYWLTFVEYVKTHIRQGLEPVEFFIEGTRSRTGKTLFPKTGMLGAILECWFMGEVPDVYIVPISISYDRILEEKLYAYELLGVPKPKESTSGLIKARGILSEDFGNVHFFIDEPISLRKFADAHGIDRGVHSLAPKVKAQLTAEEMKMLKNAAHHVIQRHNINAIISPWCLIAAILLVNQKTLLMSALVIEVDWLKRQMLNLGATVDWPVNESIDHVIQDHLTLHKELVEVVDEETSPAYIKVKQTSQDSSVRGRSLAEAALFDSAALHLSLASYRNQITFFLVREALVSSIILSSGSSVVNKNDIYKDYLLLEKLFHREFMFEYNKSEQNFDEAIANMTSFGCIEVSNDSLHLIDLENKFIRFVHALFVPFFASYKFVCQCLLKDNRLLEIAVEKDLAKAMQALAFKLDQSELVLDCLSLDLLSNSIHGLHHTRAIIRQKQSSTPPKLSIPDTHAILALLNRVSTLDFQPKHKL